MAHHSKEECVKLCTNESPALKSMLQVLKGLDLEGMAPPGSTGVLGSLRPRDPVKRWRLTCQLLHHVIRDKVMPVRLAALDLYQQAFSDLECFEKAEVVYACGVLVEHLIDRLGDSNVRLHEAARRCLIFTAEKPRLGPKSVLDRLREKLKACPKGGERAKVHFGVLDTVSALLEHFNQEVDDVNESYTAEEVAPFILVGLEDSAGTGIFCHKAMALTRLLALATAFLGVQATKKSLRPEEEAFLELDKDHSGKVEYAELEAFGKSKGMKEDQIYEEFRNMDLNHNGIIEADELRQSLLAAAPGGEVAPVAPHPEAAEAIQEAVPEATEALLSAAQVKVTQEIQSPKSTSEFEALDHSVRHSAGRVLAELFERKAAEALDTREAQRLESTASQLRGKAERLQRGISGAVETAAKTVADEILKKSQTIAAMAKFPIATGLACAAAPLFVVPKVIGHGTAPTAAPRGTSAPLGVLGVRRRAEGVRFPAAAKQPQAVEVSRKWRHRLLAAMGVAAAWLWPKMAYARVAKRPRPRDQGELSDDNMAASLRAAQQKMDGEDDEPGEGGTAESPKAEGAEGEAAPSDEGEKKETKPEEGAKDGKPKDGEKKEDDSESKSDKDHVALEGELHKPTGTTAVRTVVLPGGPFPSPSVTVVTAVTASDAASTAAKAAVRQSQFERLVVEGAKVVFLYKEERLEIPAEILWLGGTCDPEQPRGP
eukprot:s650_g5.t1